VEPGHARLSPAYPALIEWGALDRRHELTARRWTRLCWSPFKPLGGHPVLWPIYLAARERLTPLTRSHPSLRLVWADSPLDDLSGTLDADELAHSQQSCQQPPFQAR
jgi:hypothetical protein